MTLLNKAGYPSNRVAGKKYRPQRLIENNGTLTIDSVDSMLWYIPKDGKGRYLVDEYGNYIVKRANTTGCIGTKVMDVERIPSFVVKKGAPGKNKSPKPKKRNANLCHKAPKYSTSIDIEYQLQTWHKLVRARRGFHVKILLGTANQVEKNKYCELTRQLIRECPKDFLDKVWEQDEAREKTIKGRLAKKNK